ncbi:MAG: hypothetical protein LBC61_00485 [Candidatus Peribacteria bacterium]|nr:hypothetical protein [Candidatus Peribacteria bacterium]
MNEIVVYLTTEEKYNTFTQEENPLTKAVSEALESEENFVINNMTIFEKRVYVIFKKELKF